jgi:hypothetical protein
MGAQDHAILSERNTRHIGIACSINALTVPLQAAVTNFSMDLPLALQI